MSKHLEKSARTKAVQTKTALAEAFWQLYKTKPISKITVQQVTERAGVYRSTLYNYFEDVYAILEYIETNILQEWEQVVTEVLTAERQALLLHGKVEELLPLMVPFYEKNGEAIAVLVSPSGDPMFQQKIKDTLRHKIFSLLQVPEEEQEALLIFECGSSAMLAAFIKWYHEKIPFATLGKVMKLMINPGLFSAMCAYSENPEIRALYLCAANSSAPEND